MCNIEKDYIKISDFYCIKYWIEGTFCWPENSKKRPSQLFTKLKGLTMPFSTWNLWALCGDRQLVWQELRRLSSWNRQFSRPFQSMISSVKLESKLNSFILIQMLFLLTGVIPWESFYTWGQKSNCLQASMDPFFPTCLGRICLHLARVTESPRELSEKAWLSPTARGEAGRGRGRVGRRFGREAPHLQGAEVPQKHPQKQLSLIAWPTDAPVFN